MRSIGADVTASISAASSEKVTGAHSSAGPMDFHAADPSSCECEHEVLLRLRHSNAHQRARVLGNDKVKVR